MLIISELERGCGITKKKKYSDKEKILVNNRHVDLFNKSLNGIEVILDGILKDLAEYNESFLDLPKSLISALDFIISSLTKIQKGQRLALGLDNEIISEDIEPKISIIKGIDISKV